MGGQWVKDLALPTAVKEAGTAELVQFLARELLHAMGGVKLKKQKTKFWGVPPLNGVQRKRKQLETRKYKANPD